MLLVGVPLRALVVVDAVAGCAPPWLCSVVGVGVCRARGFAFAFAVEVVLEAPVRALALAFAFGVVECVAAATAGGGAIGFFCRRCSCASL